MAIDSSANPINSSLLPDFSHNFGAFFTNPDPYNLGETLWSLNPAAHTFISPVFSESEAKNTDSAVTQTQDPLTGQALFGSLLLSEPTWDLANFEQSQQPENKITAPIEQLIFVDTSIADSQRWLENASQTTKVIFLNGNDELTQIDQTLAQYHDISAIHLVTHGAAGEIFLGNQLLNADTLANYASSFQNWQTTLTSDADILLYGCDIAQGEIGQQFVQQLSDLTGADVAASTDLTGNNLLGGNWTLEYETGAIEHQSFAIQNYQSVLGLAEVSVSAEGVLKFTDRTPDLIPNVININSIANTIVSLGQVFLSYDYAVDTVNLNPSSDLNLEIRADGKLYIQDKNSQIIFQKETNNSYNSAITRIDANTVKVALSSISKIDINTDESKSLLFQGLNAFSSVADDKITFVNGFKQLSKAVNFSINGGVGTDTVIFNANTTLLTQGGNLDIQAEKITVQEGATISTRQVSEEFGSSGDSGSITFSGVTIDIQQNAEIIASSSTNTSYKSGDVKFLVVDERNLTDLLAGFGGFGTFNDAKISIGTKSVLDGNNIILDAQAKGLSGEQVSVIEKNAGKAVRLIADLLADIPAAIKAQNSTAIVDLGNYSRIYSTGEVKITSTAQADSTVAVTIKDGSTITNQFSIVLALSEATAKTLVGEGVYISSIGNVQLTSNATTIASSKARVSRNLGQAPIDNQTKAISIATAQTKAISNTIVAKNAIITSNGNVNITALGTNNNATAAETGSYEDGQFGLTLSVGVADSDIRAEVNGQITAKAKGAGKNVYVFAPNNAVDVDRDTISLGEAHQWRTGDRAIYRNHDPNDIYSTNRSIGNLVDGNTYYVIVDANQPSLVKLAKTLEDAKTGKAIDLRAIEFGQFGKGHQLELENVTTGIGIRAKLNSEESNTAEVGIGGGGLLDKIINFQETLVPALRSSEKIKKFLQEKTPGINKITDKVFTGQAGSSNSNSDWSLAGSFAVGSTDHKVQVTIGSTAILKSEKNIDIKAEQIDVPTIGAASGIEKKEGANKDTAVSTAISLGLYNNNVQTVIEGNSQLDAQQAISIESKTYYPLIFDQFSNLNITYPNEVSKKLREQRFQEASQRGYALPDYMGAFVEAKSFPTTDFSAPGAKKPWNSWTKASSESDKLGIAGAINFFKFDNTTETLINSGAKINQDSNYSSDNQSVNVKALTTGTFVNVTGNPFKPVGGANDNGGVGGSIYGSLFNNITIAKVDSGALINTGIYGGLTVDATTKITSVNFVYSGSRGKTFAVNGTVAVNLYDSVTMAQVASGAKVTGGFLTVNALDDTNYWNIVGGALLGQNVGIGASVAITDMDRNTFALIGVPDEQTTNILNSSKFNRTPTPVTPGQTVLNLAGALKVQAKNDGDNFDISLAASIVYQSSTDAEKAGDIQKQASGVSDDVLEGQSVPSQAQASNSNGKIGNDQGNQGKFGLGVSGDVSIHTITDNVFAYINDFSANDAQDSIIASQIDVNSNNDTNFFSLAGSVAFASSQQGNSAGIAGSFASNSLNGATRAYVNSNNKIIPINETFDPQKVVDFNNDTINLGNHRFSTGYAVVYYETGFSSIGGLSDGQTYYVIVDPNERQFIKLAASLDDAKAGKAIDLSAPQFSFLLGNADRLESIQGQLAVNANNRARIISITAGGSGAPNQNGVAVAGSVSLNFMNYQTTAFIDRVRGTVEGSQINVNAKDESKVIAIAGSLGLGGKAGFGAAISFNKVDNSVTATINRSDLRTRLTSINLTATNNSEIRGYVGSLGISTGDQGLGAAGTLAVNLITGKTDAAFLDSKANGSQGLPQITINATDTAFIQSIAGAIGASSANGLGAAAAYNSSDRTTTARVEGSQTQLTVKDLSIKANAKSKIESKSVGVGGGKEAGLAGSASINVIKNGVDAHIKDLLATTTNPTPIDAITLTLTAQDESSINSLAGSIAGAQTAAIGAAVAINEIGDNNKGVQAYIDNSVIKTYTSSTTAQFTGNIETIALGGSGANNFALGGSVAINNINNPVLASIRNQSQVTVTGGSLSLEATDKSTIQALGGGVAGSSQAAVGATVVKNLIGNDGARGIQANIDNATVTSNKDAIAIKAQSSAKIETTGIGGAGAGNFALGGSVVLNEIALPVVAFISNQAKVTGSKDISLIATQNSNISVKSGGIAGAGNSAVGAAVATNKIKSNGIQAYINQATVESTSGKVELTATFSGEIKAAGVGGSGAGTFALGGSVVLNEINLPVAAFISNQAKVTASSNILLSATQNSNISALSGGVAGAGGSAVGAALATNKISGDGVQAYINNATVESKSSQVELMATSSGQINAIGIGGAGAGTFAAGGSVILNEINLPVAAYITNQAKVTATQQVRLNALENSKISAIAGGVALSGTGAVGAALATNKISGNGVQAYIDGGTVSSKSSFVIVFAQSIAKIEALTLGGAGDTVASVGASVSLNEISNPVTVRIGGNAVIEAGTDITVRDENNATIIAKAGGAAVSGGGAAGAALTTNNINRNTKAVVENTSSLKAGTYVQIAAQGTSNLESKAIGVGVGLGAVGLGGSVSKNDVNGTVEAYVTDSAKIQSGTSLDIKAEQTTNFSNKVGGLGGGLFAGVGGVYCNNIINTTTQAYANGTVNLTVGSNLSINANSVVKSGTVEAYVGGAGAIGGAGAKLDITSNNKTTAYIGSNVEIAKAGNVDVYATSDSTLKSFAIGGAAGVLAAGIVQVDLKETGSTEAYLDNGIKIGSSTDSNQRPRDLVVRAIANNTLEGNTTGATAGVANGSGSLTNITATPTVKAWIGDNARIYLNKDAVVRAFANGSIQGEAWGANLSLGVAGGQSTATVEWKPTIEVTIGQGSIFDVVGNIEIASFNNHLSNSDFGTANANNQAKVAATATSSNGSLGGTLTGASAKTTINVTQKTQVKDNVQFKAGRNIDLLAQSYNPVDANATGGSSGLLAKGSAEAKVDITNNVTVETLTNVQLNSTSGNISLRSTSNNRTKDNDSNESNTVIALGGAAGVAADGGTQVILREYNRTNTSLGLNNRLIAAGAIVIDADYIGDFNVKSRQEILTGGVSTNQSQAEIIIDSLTKTDISSNAQVEGKKISIKAQDSSSNIFAKADAESKTLAATTRATAKIATNLNANTNIGSNSIFKAPEAVTITTRQSDVRSKADAYAYRQGLPRPEDTTIFSWIDKKLKGDSSATLEAISDNNQLTKATLNFGSEVKVISGDFSYFARIYSSANNYQKNSKTGGISGQESQKGNQNNTENVTGKTQYTRWFVVDNSGDEENGNFEPGDLTLREAINLTSGINSNLITFANAIQQIQLTREISYVPTRQPVTIDGGTQQVEIKGSNQNRIFTVESYQTLTLKNLFLTEGKADNGGLIYNRGTLNIINSVLRGGKATGKGGGIFNYGSLNLINSVVTGNTSDIGGGINNIRDLFINNSVIASNFANFISGINSDEENSASYRVSIQNSTIVGNGGNEGGAKDIQLFISYTGKTQPKDRDTTIIANNIILSNRNNSDDKIFYLRNYINSVVFKPEDANAVITNNLINSPYRFNIDYSPNIFQSNWVYGDPALENIRVEKFGASFYVPIIYNPYSPAVNKGNNNYVPKDTFDLDGDGNTNEPIPVDQRGKQRVYDGTVDIGAQEYQPGANNATQALAAPTTLLAVQPAALAATPTTTTLTTPVLAESIQPLSLQSLPIEKVLIAPVAQISLERGEIWEISGITSDNYEDIFAFNQLPSQGIIEFIIDGETRKITRSLSDPNPDLISNADLRRGELVYIHNGSHKQDSFEILNQTQGSPARFDININNTAPILSVSIKEQVAIENEEFEFALPGDTFYDADWEVGDKLTYKAELSDGTPLPTWLKFDSEAGVFWGTPSDRDLNLLEIQVTATDESGASVSSKFYLRIDHNFFIDRQIRPNTPFNYHFESDPDFTYTATLDDGSPFPSWLTFDSQTLTFSGTPTAKDVGLLYIKVTATDNQGYKLDDTFTLEVANWIVDNATDEDDGDVSSGDVSLREAIRLAQDGDTIAFASSLNKQVIKLTQGEILINKSLTLSGQGEFATIISGNQQHRIFTIDDGNANQQSQVELFSIGLTGGKVTDNGGAIWNKENLSLTNTTLNHNQAGNFGGAIWNDKGTITIENSGIYQNTAVQAGGAIANSGTLSLNLTDIDRNTTTGKGGGIYNTGTFTLRSSTINDNIAGAYISIENGKPSFELESAGTGGGIFSEGGKVSLIDGEMNHNAAALFGGAIAMNQGQLIVENSSILKNLAQTGAGISIVSGNASIVNSTITLNETTQQGGGIYGDRSNINMFNSTLVYNRAINDSPTTNGAGIHLQGGQLLLANSIIAKNTTTPIGGTPVSTDVVNQNQAQILTLGSNIVEDGSVTGNGVLNVDPQLAPLQEINYAWVYPLLLNSPAKDKGENGLRPVDLGDLDADGNTGEAILVDGRGSDRLSGNKIDLGAYEIQQPQTTVNEEIIDWVRGDILIIDDLETREADIYSLYKLPEQGELTFTLDEVTQKLTQTFDSDNPVLLRGIDLRNGILEYTHNGTSKDGSLELINLKDGSIIRLVFSLTNKAPEVKQAIADQAINEQQEFTIEIPGNIFDDADMFLNDDVSQGDIDPEDRSNEDNTGAPRSDSLTYSATLADGSPLPKWLSFDAVNLRFVGKASFADIGTLEIRLTATDERNAQTSTTFRLIVNQTTPSLELSAPVANILQRKGDFENSSLQFTLTGKNVQQKVINEVGFFVVDDAQGRIGDLFPNSPGYLQAALLRAQVIFSVLPDDFVPNPTRILKNIAGQFLSFYLIQDGSTDDVINDPTQAYKVLFGSNQDGGSVLQVSSIDLNSLQLTFNDQLANNSQGNITLTISQNDSKAPIGTSLQGQHEREIVDLSDYVGQTLIARFPIIKSEAAFNNTVGFYRIENPQGTVIDPTTGQSFNPGDAGYTLAAIRNSQAYGISFDRHSQGVSAKWQGGYLYVPYIIANGTIAQLLDDNTNNDSLVYFIYRQANPDKVDHIRLLGDNTWGFEDLPQGGDLDFNDMVISLFFQDSEISFDIMPAVEDVSLNPEESSQSLTQSPITSMQDTQESSSNLLSQPQVNYLSSELDDALLPEVLQKAKV
ncbi:DUF4347 domain-containing protein [Calothrix sp. NIES-2098]|uniref:DUF4347 domain-containing protein n=1 Tax=Calothrix sp. NIES-2098 TaxID=1954171 RepID=UPI000B604441|nr:GLUG domain-containing protein [Calothrix sp. NIES-2098]